MSIRRVAVLGAGVMGSGIAAHIANAGIDVVLLDIVPEGANNRSAIAAGAVEKMLKTKPAPFMDPRNARRMGTMKGLRPRYSLPFRRRDACSHNPLRIAIVGAGVSPAGPGRRSAKQPPWPDGMTSILPVGVDLPGRPCTQPRPSGMP